MTEKGKATTRGASSAVGDRRSQKKTTGSYQQQYPRYKPRFSVGMIADIQYAPFPDGFSHGGVPRYYRHSLEVARHAAEKFEQKKVSLMVNLGDLVDLKCTKINAGSKAANEVLAALRSYQNIPELHVVGNHCLYNMDRETLKRLLGLPFTRESCGELVGYYSHTYRRIRFVTIDSYDITKQKRPKTSQKYKKAVEIMSKENLNYFKNENSPAGLERLKKRFVAFNGAVGQIQLEWLRKELKQARRNCERVIILSHQPIHPGSTKPTCLMWNYGEVLTVLRDYKDVIIASFSGHAHHDGYRRDKKSGIHFRVLKAPLECKPPKKTYAILDVHDDFIELKGYNCKSAVYKCDHLVPRRRRQQQKVIPRYATTR